MYVMVCNVCMYLCSDDVPQNHWIHGIIIFHTSYSAAILYPIFEMHPNIWPLAILCKCSCLLKILKDLRIDKLWFKSFLGKSGENRYCSTFSLEYICFSGFLAFQHRHCYQHLTTRWYQWNHLQQLTPFCRHQNNSRPNCWFMLNYYVDLFCWSIMLILYLDLLCWFMLIYIYVYVYIYICIYIRCIYIYVYIYM